MKCCDLKEIQFKCNWKSNTKCAGVFLHFFNKDLEFEVSDDSLKITFDKISKTHQFNSMRQCLISETGILFKISWSEYYYISYKSLDNDRLKLNLMDSSTIDIQIFYINIFSPLKSSWLRIVYSLGLTSELLTLLTWLMAQG